MLVARSILGTLIATFLAVGLLAGCGQKGPLYLPPPPEAQVVSPGSNGPEATTGRVPSR